MFSFEKCSAPATKTGEVSIKEMDSERKDSNKDLRALRPSLAKMNWQDTRHKSQDSSREAEQPISTTISVDMPKAASILLYEEEEANQSYREISTPISATCKE